MLDTNSIRCKEVDRKNTVMQDNVVYVDGVVTGVYRTAVQSAAKVMLMSNPTIDGLEAGLVPIVEAYRKIAPMVYADELLAAVKRLMYVAETHLREDERNGLRRLIDLAFGNVIEAKKVCSP